MAVTPNRTVRIPVEEWEQAKAAAAVLGGTVTDHVRYALKVIVQHAAKEHPEDYLIAVIRQNPERYSRDRSGG